MTWTAHSSVEVDNGAVVGDGTRLWHHTHIRSGARIGNDCTIGKNVYIDAGVTVGDRVKIQNNVSIYQGVTVEDEVFLGPSCVFTNDLHPRAAAPSWEVVATTVATGASVGANATIICGTTIGRWAMVAAGSVVTHDVAPHQLVAGNPARHRGWVCRCGEIINRDADAPPHLDRCDHEGAK